MDRKYREAMSNKDEVDILNSKLKSRNNELEMELQDVDRLAKRLETDKSIVLKTADREMGEAKVLALKTLFCTCFLVSFTSLSSLFIPISRWGKSRKTQRKTIWHTCKKKHGLSYMCPVWASNPHWAQW